LITDLRLVVDEEEHAVVRCDQVVARGGGDVVEVELGHFVLSLWKRSNVVVGRGGGHVPAVAGATSGEDAEHGVP
jgi:hypothetical protein